MVVGLMSGSFALIPPAPSGAASHKKSAEGFSTRFRPTVANPTTATSSDLATATKKHHRALPLASGGYYGPTISAATILSRAQSWVNEGVPYSESAYWTDANGTYRQDCSGYVSMAWDLNTNSTNYGLTTGTLPKVATELNPGNEQASIDALQPGDMVDLTTTHVVLFAGWQSVDSVAFVYQESQPGTDAEYTTLSVSYFLANGYWGYQYNNMVNSPATPTGLRSSSVTQTTDQIVWNAVSGATNYYLYRWFATTNSNCPSGGTFTGNACTNTWSTSDLTSFINEDLSPGGTYGYQVAAVNGSGWSPYSAPIYVTSLPATPQTPVVNSFAPSTSSMLNSGGTVTLTAAASNATSYAFSSSQSGLTGLDTVQSSSGTATDVVTVPPNQTASRIIIPFTVTVTGPGGTTSSSTDLIELFGRFTGSGQSQVVLYSPIDQNWWLGTMSGGSLGWKMAGNTSGFGDTASFPVYVGNFTGSASQLLMFSTFDQSWHLGSFTGSTLTWATVGNTSGFGAIGSDPMWTGNFTGSGQTQIVFYSSFNQDWFLGSMSGGSLVWTQVANTSGFGNTASFPVYVGNFTGSASQLLMFSTFDQSWHLGSFTGTSLAWATVGNTSGFGAIGSDPMWTGNFTGSGQTQIVFYSSFNQDWFLGSMSGGSLVWTQVANTSGFGNTASFPVYVGNFTGSASQLLMFSTFDQSWHLGSFTGSTLTWATVGNTSGFGAIGSDPMWIGNFTGSGQSQVLFYSSFNQDWFLGSMSGGSLVWTQVANTSGFGNTTGNPTWIT